MPDAILVTGAAGFAGSHLLQYLAQASFRLKAEATSEPGAGGVDEPVASGFSREIDLVAWGRSAPPPELPAPARWEIVDMLDRDRVREAIARLRPSRIFHCAGAAHVGGSWTHTLETLSTNVLATHYLFDAVRRGGLACRVFVPGSAHVYAPSARPIAEDAPIAPASPYAISKLAQEQLAVQAIAQDGIEAILARVFNHTGPGQKPIFVASSMARQIAQIERGAQEPVIKVGNLDAERDLTDVRDTVRAYVLLMDRGTPGTLYNVASGVAHSARHVLETLLEYARVPIRVEVDPARMRPNDIPVLVGDPGRLRDATGWTTRISFEQMLRDLLEYWRASSGVSP